MRRREFLAGAAGLALGPAFWERALHARARAAASVRLTAPSLSKTWVTCFLTVLSATVSSSAIS